MSGAKNNRITTRTPESQSLTRNGIALTATQVLWDGQSTRKEVERLGHARLTRYFRFLALIGRHCPGGHRAYLDVQRYRKLVTGRRQLCATKSLPATSCSRNSKPA